MIHVGLEFVEERARNVRKLQDIAKVPQTDSEGPRFHQLNVVDELLKLCSPVGEYQEPRDGFYATHELRSVKSVENRFLQVRNDNIVTIDLGALETEELSFRDSYKPHSNMFNLNGALLAQYGKIKDARQLCRQVVMMGRRKVSQIIWLFQRLCYDVRGHLGSDLPVSPSCLDEKVTTSSNSFDPPFLLEGMGDEVSVALGTSQISLDRGDVEVRDVVPLELKDKLRFVSR